MHGSERMVTGLPNATAGAHSTRSTRSMHGIQGMEELGMEHLNKAVRVRCCCSLRLRPLTSLLHCSLHSDFVCEQLQLARLQNGGSKMGDPKWGIHSRNCRYHSGTPPHTPPPPPAPCSQCALIVGQLWLAGDLGVRKRLLMLLHQKGHTLGALRELLLEYRASLGEDGGSWLFACLLVWWGGYSASPLAATL